MNSVPRFLILGPCVRIAPGAYTFQALSPPVPVFVNKKINMTPFGARCFRASRQLLQQGCKKRSVSTVCVREILGGFCEGISVTHFTRDSLDVGRLIAFKRGEFADAYVGRSESQAR